MNYGKHMNDLVSICTQVWSEDTLEGKKDKLREAIKSFKYKAKSDQFLDEINKTASKDRLDTIVSNLILNKTDKVVSMLPR